MNYNMVVTSMLGKVIISLLCFFIVNSVPTHGNDKQDIGSNKNTPFSSNYACFKGNKKQTYIEIYSQVDLSALSAVKEAITFLSEYSLKYTIRANDKIVRELNFDDTFRFEDNSERSNKMRLSVQGILLQPGYYSCEIQLTDKNAPYTVSRPMYLDVPEFAVTNLILSDIQVAQSIQASKKTSAFIKNGLFVKPNVDHSFDYFTAEFFIYYEVYGLAAAETQNNFGAEIMCKIKTEDGVVKKTVQHSVSHPATDAVHSLRLSIMELSRGGYELEVLVKDRNSGKVAVNRTQFFVGWSDEYSQKEVVSDLIKQLQYVAPQWNFESMQELATEKQRIAILSFWKNRDPSPETIENELMDEFYKRVSFANNNFKNYENKGWKSDQGRIYIQNGYPVSVRRLRSRSNSSAYEIWKYGRQDKRFIFENKNSFGDFRLIPQGSMEYFELAEY
ncbi:MAG: hypothetical protein DWQ05_11810 [Calditrichaeota bacterium]|nr:MAG: hypothetical protein DWQ05_11810 [Calditrichota bacterium]